MMPLFLHLGVLAAMVALAGCADPSVQADALAETAGLSRQAGPVGRFTLTAFARQSRSELPVTIYIEGDGHAWQSRGEPSLDPTPRNPLALSLASADPSPNVIYLARPCQFAPGDPACDVSYWTGKRFAPEVIDSMNHAIDKLVKPGQKIHLVGYSGGAAVAVLVAASRQDVVSLRTVAGNLDSEAFNRYHEVSAMPESLNPVNVAPKLALLPQEHFVGDKDEIVPPLLAGGFVKATGGRCVAVTHVRASHDEGWAAFWRGAVSRLPACHD